ncbi:hypothetical protein GGF32_008023 [Allomyces javanicus]|nr:hypothetical protein GGF32_008023 [Allomyces javanicus]
MTAAYGADTLIRLADRSTKRLGDVVEDDLILDAFQRQLRVTYVDHVVYDECYTVDVFYTERNTGEYQAPTITMARCAPLFLATVCSPTRYFIRDYMRTGTSYVGLKMAMLRFKPDFFPQIATCGTVPGTQRIRVPWDELPQELARVAALINQHAGSIVYWNLAVHQFNDYLDINHSKHKKITHMIRTSVPTWSSVMHEVLNGMPGNHEQILADSTWTMRLSWIVHLWMADGARRQGVVWQKRDQGGIALRMCLEEHAAALGMRVNAMYYFLHHPTTNAPTGIMMQMKLVNVDPARNVHDTIFRRVLQRLGVFQAKVYGPEVLALLLADNECIRASAVGGFTDGDGTGNRNVHGEIGRWQICQKYKGEDVPVLLAMRELARSLGHRVSLFEPTPCSVELYSKKTCTTYLYEHLMQRIEITTIAIPEENLINFFISRPNRQAAEEPIAEAYLPRRLYREQVQAEVREALGERQLVRIRTELVDPLEPPYVYDELSGTTSLHPIIHKPTMITADNIVLQLRW